MGPGGAQGGTAVFAFRGTESFQDAKVDADFLMKKIAWMTRHFPNVRAHRGTRPAIPLDTDENEGALCMKCIPANVGPVPFACACHGLQ